jgi:MFS family permease
MIENSSMSSRDRRILIVTCYGHFMSHFNMLVFPAVVLPLTLRLNMAMGPVLELSFWMYLLFGLTALPWGAMADRYGARPLLFLFFLGTGLSGLSAAFSLESTGLLAFSLGALGLFSGIYHPTGLGLISKELERFSLGMGYNGMFGNIGLATAPLLAGGANWLWGPTAVYVLVGIANLFGLALLRFLPRDKREMTGELDKAGENGHLSGFVILLMAMMLGGIAYRGSTVILPAYFELKNQGIFQCLSSLVGTELSGNLVATSVTSFIFLIGILGQYLGGHIAERREPRYSYLIFHAVTVPIAFFMAYFSDLPLVLLSLIYFFFLLGMQPIENTLVAKLTPQRLHHSAFGTKFILTFGVGALAVKMAGRVEATWGLGANFPVLSAVSLALVGTVFVLIAKTPSLKP